MRPWREIRGVRQPKERGIIFSAEMVRAILKGRKSQTRRVVKPQPVDHQKHCGCDWPRGKYVFKGSRAYPWPESFENGRLSCPHGSPGDLLYVKEAWRLWEGPSFDGFGEPLDPDIFTRSLKGADIEWLKSRPTEYRADTGGDGPWRSPLFMPKWAARIWLRITDVRVERVQDISKEDTYAEGVIYPPRAWSIANFAELWDAINGKRPGCSWQSNPWVFAISFERIDR